MSSSISYPVRKITRDTVQTTVEISRKEDFIAVEAPLIIRHSLNEKPEELNNVATLLRTPTNDYYLACGFLFAEGYLNEPQQILMHHYCDHDDAITIVSDEPMNHIKRPHLTHSGCGSCALELLDSLYQQLKPVEKWVPSTDYLFQLIENLPSQPLFQQSGGTHAAVILDENVSILSQDEDVGRHNALDKAIGKLWSENALCQNKGRAKIAWVSGRIGFELVQKCINAHIPNIISVGAPTSLSVDFAKKYGVGLYAFSRNNRFNQYC